MKLQLGLIAAAVIAMSASSDTRAIGINPEPGEASCTLDISASYIPFGQNFTFGVGIYFDGGEPGVPTFGYRPRPPFTITFYGTKDGVDDIPTGFQHPGTFPYGYNTLGGYGNPVNGGFSGTYVRYAVIADRLGRAFCVTDSVTTTLQ
jgi:hypothetical protein